MRAYTAATLAPFLDEVRASNLTPNAKTIAGQLAADAVALRAKVEVLEAELAKLGQPVQDQSRTGAFCPQSPGTMSGLRDRFDRSAAGGCQYADR